MLPKTKGIPYDHCSMRWSGVVRPEKTANYRFIVRGFDGFRLKIGTEMLINEWRDQGNNDSVRLYWRWRPGRNILLSLEYFANVHPVDIFWMERG